MRGPNEKPQRLQKGQKHPTPTQEEYVQQFVQERIATMLATTAIDEDQAEEHLRLAYRVAGFELPAVRWFDSPITFVQASVSMGGNAGKSVRNKVETRVGKRVRRDVRNGVGKSIGRSVRSDMEDSIQESIVNSVANNMWNNVRVSTAASMWNSAGTNVENDSTWDSVVAYYNEVRLAFYRFFHEMFEENPLIHLALFNEMVSGYRLGSREAWLVRKPIRLQRDAQGRLHSEDGMCVQYRDGWGFYAWHGVRVPEKIILHPESLTKQDWLAESNLELRRIMQERLGNEHFVELLGGVCIDTGTRGTLIQIDLLDDPERVAHYVKVKDASTPREYYLRVPPFITRADEAVAWTFGLEPQTYQPTRET